MEKNTVKILANSLALSVPFLLVLPFFLRYFFDFDFSPEQYLSYSIGMASPLAALAGYLFVYLSFIQQGEQSKFEKDKTIFDQYINTYQTVLNELDFSIFMIVGKGRETIFKDEQQRGRLALILFINRLHDWIQKDWEKQNPVTFNKSVGIPFIPKRKDVDKSNITKEEAFLLIKAVSSERAFGQYFSILRYLLDHIKNSNYPVFLLIFEATLTFEEKVFLFHYCPIILDNDLSSFLKKNNFLQLFPEKHWKSFFNQNYWR